MVLGIVLVALNARPERILSFLDWVTLHRQEGSVIFVVMYVLGVVLMLPAMVMAMSAGALFGIVGGSALSFIGSNIGQVGAFMAGRYIFRDAVVSYLSKNFPKWTLIDGAMTREGWRMIVLLRMSPIAPWNLLNYALSVTSVPFATYAIASSLSIIPYLVLFVYFGSMARNLADVVTGDAKIDGRWTAVMALCSGVALVLLVWYVAHVSRKAMAEMVNEEDVSELLGSEHGRQADHDEGSTGERQIEMTDVMT